MFQNLFNKVKKFFAESLEDASVMTLVETFHDPNGSEDVRSEAAGYFYELSSKLSDMDTEKPETTRVANKAYAMLLDVLDREHEEDWVYEKAILGMNEITNMCRYEMDKRLLRDSYEVFIDYLSEEETDEVRTRAASILGSLEGQVPVEYSQRAIDAICEELEDPSDEVRSGFLLSLGTFGEKAQDLWEDVAEFLDDKSPSVRENAASALWMIGNEEPTPKVIDQLIEMLAHDPNGEVRSNVANALGHLGKGLPRVVDALIDALRDDAARHFVIFAFNDLGEEAAKAVPHLEPWLDDEDFCDAAELVLQNIGTPQARAILRKHGLDEE